MTTREAASTGFNGKPSSCQPGCVNLQQYLMKQYNLGNSGCYSATSVLSSGSPSWHQYGKAIDLTCNWNNSDERSRGLRCWQWILDHKEDLNLQQMIFGNQIVDVRDGHKVRGYSGTDHFNHIHVAIGYAASQTWTSSQQPPAPVPPDKRKTPDMTAFLYRDPTNGAVFLVAGNTRQHLSAIQRDLYILAAGKSGTPLVDLGNLNPEQLTAINRTPLVGAP